MTELQLTSIFCLIDDFCKQFFCEFQKHLIGSKEKIKKLRKYWILLKQMNQKVMRECQVVKWKLIWMLMWIMLQNLLEEKQENSQEDNFKKYFL